MAEGYYLRKNTSYSIENRAHNLLPEFSDRKKTREITQGFVSDIHDKQPVYYLPVCTF